MRQANTSDDSQKNILQSQTNANEQHTKENYSNKIIERIPIENSPFTVILHDDNTYFVVMGKYKITEPEELLITEETLKEIGNESLTLKDIPQLAAYQAEQKLQENIWNIIGTVTVIIIQDTIERLYDLKPKQDI
jgi:hypothetical protein